MSTISKIQPSVTLLSRPILCSSKLENTNQTFAGFDYSETMARSDYVYNEVYFYYCFHKKVPRISPKRNFVYALVECDQINSLSRFECNKMIGG